MLSNNDKEIILTELQREDLQVFTCVRIALYQAEHHAFERAIEYLKVDTDKVRCYSTTLYSYLI